MALKRIHNMRWYRGLWLAVLAIMLGGAVGLLSGSTTALADDAGNKWIGYVETRLEPMTAGDWTIGGKVFSVSEQTMFDPATGSLDIGACAQVYYRSVEDGLVASKIRSIAADKCEDQADDSGDDHGKPGDDDVMRAYGILNTLPDDGQLGTWQIGGEFYEISQQTELDAEHGPFEVGACLQVEYWLSENEQLAKEIETERQYKCGNGEGDDTDPGEGDPGEGNPEEGDSRYEARLYGVIFSFPEQLVGDWKIGGLEIVADDSTEFDQERLPFAENVVVKVKFYTDDAGIHHALEIESKFSIWGHEEEDDDHGDHHEDRGGHAYGLIQQWPSKSSMGPIGTWKIGGMDYIVLPETRLVQRKAEFGVGVPVRVKYRVDADDRRIARIIRTTGPAADIDQPTRSTLVSLVESMPETGFDGAWKVGNVDLMTTDESHFSERHGLLAVGAYVEVEYISEDATGDSSEGAINYIVKMETRVPPGVGGHKHRGRIAHMGDGHVAAASADGVSADELWVIGEQQIRIVAATDLDETAIELDVNVLVEVDSYTGDDGIEVATRVQSLSESNIIFLPFVAK